MHSLDMLWQISTAKETMNKADQVIILMNPHTLKTIQTKQSDADEPLSLASKAQGILT